MTGTTTQRPHFDPAVMARALRVLITAGRDLNEKQFIKLIAEQVGKDCAQDLFDALFDGCFVGIHVSSAKGDGTSSRKGDQIGRVVLMKDGVKLLRAERLVIEHETTEGE